MKRMIKVLMVAVLMAVILAASVSPALAAKARGGVLLSTTQPCHAIANTQDASGERPGPQPTRSGTGMLVSVAAWCRQ